MNHDKTSLSICQNEAQKRYQHEAPCHRAPHDSDILDRWDSKIYFHNTTSRYAPAYGRFGMRLTF